MENMNECVMMDEVIENTTEVVKNQRSGKGGFIAGGILILAGLAFGAIKLFGKSKNETDIQNVVDDEVVDVAEDEYEEVYDEEETETED